MSPLSSGLYQGLNSNIHFPISGYFLEMFPASIEWRNLDLRGLRNTDTDEFGLIVISRCFTKCWPGIRIMPRYHNRIRTLG